MYISWPNNEVNNDERITMQQLVHHLYPGQVLLEELEIHEEEFLKQQTLEEKTFEQETINQRYEEMKHRVNV